MTSRTISTQVFLEELKAANGDRNKLSKLHSVVTESINNSYGEEKLILTKFRQKVKDALNCHLLNN